MEHIEAIKERLSGHQAQIARNEQDIGSLCARVGSIEVSLASINTKLDYILQRMATIRSENNSNFVTYRYLSDIMLKVIVSAGILSFMWKLFFGGGV